MALQTVTLKAEKDIVAKFEFHMEFYTLVVSKGEKVIGSIKFGNDGEKEWGIEDNIPELDNVFDYGVLRQITNGDKTYLAYALEPWLIISGTKAGIVFSGYNSICCIQPTTLVATGEKSFNVWQCSGNAKGAGNFMDGDLEEAGFTKLDLTDMADGTLEAMLEVAESTACIN